MIRLKHFSPIAIGLFLAILAQFPQPAVGKTISLGQIEHVHGITVSPTSSSNLMLATHSGLYSATEDGFAERVSDINVDMMSFAVDPKNSSRLFTSGHLEKGGNFGVMKSDDGGKSWKHISDGLDGPVDFHSMAISPINPETIYGTYKGLQKSMDGGKNWKLAGTLPDRTFSIAASAKNPSTLYAGTMTGLMISYNEGESWKPGMMAQKPTTMVHVTPQGRLYVFAYGTGLLTAMEPDLAWTNLSKNFQDRALMSFAIDPTNSNRLFAVADTGTVMASKNGGKNWSSFEGFVSSTPEVISRGEKLYADNCQQCHGEKGIGERPGEPDAKDEYGFVAPALNNDAHGWHHPDQQIASTILNGSPRNERMIAWKQILSEEDAKSLVAYIKSLWSFRSLACQGAKHMACMR